MNTKTTIINNQLFHLYEKENDSENVYLDLEDLSGCCFEIWEEDGNTKSYAEITIPIEAWKNIVKAWNKRDKNKKNAPKLTKTLKRRNKFADL